MWFVWPLVTNTECPKECKVKNYCQCKQLSFLFLFRHLHAHGKSAKLEICGSHDAFGLHELELEKSSYRNSP